LDSATTAVGVLTAEADGAAVDTAVLEVLHAVRAKTLMMAVSFLIRFIISIFLISMKKRRPGFRYKPACQASAW
jgi:hypothetical protein